MSTVMKDLNEYIEETWDQFDKDGSGKLELKEFQEFANICCDHYKVNFDERMSKLFKSFDKDGDGHIDREEAFAFMLSCWIGSRVTWVWNKLVKGKDDALSKRQFRVFARDCLQEMGFDSNWSTTKLNRRMAEFDADGDGEIDYDEAFDFLKGLVGNGCSEAQQEEEYEL